MITQLNHTITPENLGEVWNIVQSKAVTDLNFFWLGRQSYQPVWELQKMVHAAVVSGEISDIVFLLEHEHVYTFGKNADHTNLLNTYPKDAEVVQIDRGGDITYHGPGQLVGYPILNLRKYRMSASWYINALEKAVIETLKSFGITAALKKDLIGVWAGDRKICAMGIRLSKWATMHGFALNIAPDMSYFAGMIPCGIQEFGVISMRELLPHPPDIIEMAQLISQQLTIQFHCS